MAEAQVNHPTNGCVRAGFRFGNSGPHISRTLMLDERSRCLDVGTEEEVVGAVRTASLANRRTAIEAVPQRFSMALEEASRLLEPKAVRVTLPSATIKREKELDEWTEAATMAIKDKLKDGPVIV